MPNARVGVRLGPPDDVTAWIAQGAAFDAAGAHALWLDLRDHPELDPYVLTAALAAATYRCRLVLHPAQRDASGSKESTLAVICRGRLVLGVEEATPVDGEPAAFDEPVDKTIDEAGDEAVDEAGDGTTEEVSDEAAAEAGDATIGDGRDGARRWEAIEFPDGRAAWRAALAAADERGVHGVIVPADPRLLDLLRNPDEEIDRRDLQLAAG